MYKEKLKQIKLNNREGEKGAAMVMALLISFLLLIISAGILYEASMNTANVTDAIAEQQAYNAAESGIQATLNVLRGNVPPNPLIDSSQSASHPNNKIDFKKAIKLSTSNKPGDSNPSARLSRWIPYNYTPGGSAIAQRVSMGPDTYDPLTGYAYSVTVEDPDNTGTQVSYSTSAIIDGSTGAKTITSGGNTVTISYNPYSVNNLDVSSGSANTNFGSFRITGGGASFADDIRFVITVHMTKPYNVTRQIRGFIEAGEIEHDSVEDVKINYDSPNVVIMGSTISLNNDPQIPNPPNTNGGITVIAGTMSPAEPVRLLVRSVGYGPRGARKELEAIVQKNFFNGMSAPATLTLVGSTNGFVFDAGQSQNVTYSGDDVVSNVIIPPIGTTNEQNLNTIKANLAGSSSKADIIGTPSNVNVEMPFWLQSAQNLDATLQALKTVALASGRYFPSGVEPPNIGNNATARGITYVDGDLELKGAGGGILVVRGNLTLHGGFDFNGLIVVTGPNGVDRRGGGNGVLQGNVVIAPYNPNDIAAGFSAPKYDISGGGTSEITYNSSSVANGMTAVSNFVLGVAEK